MDHRIYINVGHLTKESLGEIQKNIGDLLSREVIGDPAVYSRALCREGKTAAETRTITLTGFHPSITYLVMDEVEGETDEGKRMVTVGSETYRHERFDNK